jgi:hypothetical protein
MDNAQLIILILRILINLYGQSQTEYNPYTDVFILDDKIEKICLLGDFAGANEIIICDNPFFYNCGFQNKQKVILMGQTQVLIELNPYPWKVPDKLWIHPLNKGKPIHPNGYRMDMGFVYTRVHQLQ